jgi:LCP family protein required for cell wall assembly
VVATAVPVPTPAPEVTPEQTGHLNVLLLGIDQRPDEATPGGDPGRTDSMVLVSIDFDDRMVSMVSIPRDGFVVIPGHGNERVNAAYTFGELDQRGGGPALAEKTVEQLFGIPIDRYALVDIHSMEQVIDDLGGASHINLTPAYRKMVHAMVVDPQIGSEQAAISVLNAGAPAGSGSQAAVLLGAAGLIVNEVATAPRVAATRIEAGGGARHSAELAARVLGLPADALTVIGGSTTIRVLLGPDCSYRRAADRRLEAGRYSPTNFWQLPIVGQT